MNSGSVGLKGADEMAKVLRQLPAWMQRRVITRALRAAAKPILAAAIGLAPIGTRSTTKYWRSSKGTQSADYGHLRDNMRIITVGAKKSAADGTVLVTTGDAFWGRWVELGRRGAPMRMTPFLGPAFNANVQTSIDILGEELGKGLEKAAENLAGPYLKSGYRK